MSVHAPGSSPRTTSIRVAGRARARRLRDEDELSLREICAVLETEVVRPKRGDRRHPETVRRMLANPTSQPPTLRRGERNSPSGQNAQIV